MEKLKNIVFDDQDRELFLIDDLSLKADAIRFSILPKLELVIHHAITQIDKVYHLNVYDDCSIAQAPHFRLGPRQNEIKKDYQYAMVRIKGHRTYGKWKGIKKPDGSEPKIAPYSLGLELVEDGMFITLVNNEQLVSKQTHKKIFKFLAEHDTEISIIQKCARVFENRFNHPSDWAIVDNATWLKLKLENDDFDFPMISDPINYPIGYFNLLNVVNRLTLLFPVFHSYIQIAKNKPVIFSELVQHANDWLCSDDFGLDKKYGETEEGRNVLINMDLAKKRAETKIKVMPGIRWQVFQRDGWRCVACGVKATDNDSVILHVDHINPRSKGGKNELDNYQTLCNKCNIGKSNSGNNDLRKISSRA